jgi:hypothetical protein
MGQLRAGVSRTTITPPVGMHLMGYIVRDKGSISVQDDLVTTALVLSDGETRLAIVTCDLLFLHPTTVSSVRSLVFERTGIPAENVMLCCSHTHSGPVTFVVDDQVAAWADRRAYLDTLVVRIVRAVGEANQSLQDAVWGIGRGKVAIGVNRRQRLADGRMILGEDPEGPIDPDVLILRVDAAPGDQAPREHPRGDVGHPLAVLVNYACHAVCLSGSSYVISADWPGVMRRAVEASTGAMVGFLQGACADINPLGGPQDTLASGQLLGTRIAQQVLDLYYEVALERDVDLRGTRQEIGLPLLGPLGHDGRPVPAFEELADRALRAFGDDANPGETFRQEEEVAGMEAVALLDHRFPWAAEVEEQEGVWHTRAELQAFRLNDVVLVAIAAEPFVEVGLEVKAESTAAFTFFAGYANGSVGYLPVPLAYNEGGYEVDSSYVCYRLPAPLAPACAELVIGGALATIEALEPTL